MMLVVVIVFVIVFVVVFVFVGDECFVSLWRRAALYFFFFLCFMLSFLFR